MLILEVLLGLKSKQKDITAFHHANLEGGENIFVETLIGFQKKDKVSKLKKMLNGLLQAPHAFLEYLVETLEACGMFQSKLYPCLFIGEKVISICYVDLLFWLKDKAHNN